VKLKRLEIHNYKSLRNVVLEPGPLAVFVGPNASGKSNLADALDFLGEVYRWNLEGAIKKKGGYENICFRQAKRSAPAIRFRVVLEVENIHQPLGLVPAPQMDRLVFDHTFEISNNLQVLLDDFSVYGCNKDSNLLIIRLIRSNDKLEIEVPKRTSAFVPLRRPDMEKLIDSLPASELLPAMGRILTFLAPSLSTSMAGLRVFQLSPRHCREAGIPTPNADLDRFGRNLPAVIDYLKSKEPRQFSQLLNSARRIMPSLESIKTDSTHTKSLGLFLKEAGVEKPWTAEEISDGTIQAIALLAATFDARIPILVIEEPENSVHPWAIRNFVEAFRTASKQKQIFLTTHSPVLIDQIRPEELWVVQRPKLETRIIPLLELDPSLKESWGQGKFTLSEYLDSGVLPEAVPAAGV